MPPPKRHRRPSQSDELNQFLAEVQSAAPIETLTLEEEKSPQKLVESFHKAERYRRHWFVDGVLNIRQAFANYGFTLKAKRKADNEKLKAYLEEDDNQETLELLADYVDELWREWFTLGNCISFWRDDSKRPILLDLTEVKYSDKWGTEELRIRHH
jgi:hypothetical protein